MKKVLFVIPAHNEAENIGAVLDEIKRDAGFADVVVIDDYSTDKTAEIVSGRGVSCIRNVFNLGYAWAMQVGIKYACENGYDYVIQFDADGQHIAKEATRLYGDLVENGYDIVIGSRYVKKTGYKCPFFRRVGTAMFSGLIRVFCRKKIKDPLSGFQCLSRRVIERYARMGVYPEFPDANLIIEMLYKGYRIHEVPVKMRARTTGGSMHGGVIKPMVYMVDVFYAIVFVVIKNLGFRKRGDDDVRGDVGADDVSAGKEKDE